ncbi:hypothetical protein FAB82_07270 [Glycomyces buryatensis]|uniref:OmpR/PhoB-type domain-containing protein n=2 Tax=Glycomyces buryatensis TaxID=2570927 RepID=A0A4S8QH09_9ACTN|nr:hypothetical protein FAB82_07270 [Glycomyces buryatensis]
MQRNLLGVLLARCGQHVPLSELSVAVWSGSPPPSAASSLQVHVHRLRRALGGSRRIAPGPSGYRIDVTADEFDVLRFTELSDRGRRERAEEMADAAVESLERALALWRGEPYSGIAPSPLIVAEAARMTEMQVGAQQELFELRLDRGDHQQLVASLTELVQAHPYHERLAALLMLALYRASRQAEALEMYRTRRKLLVTELGVEPGELLRRMHEAVLRGDERLADVATATLEGTWTPVARRIVGGTTAVPRELPMAPHGFFGRDGEVQRLDRLLATDTAPIAVLTGMGGIGKTALAVHWAHRVADRFPDGQMFIDLRGHSGGTALRPIDALAALLGSLDVAADQIPLDVDQASAKFRTCVEGRRMLIVLDNAASADQVRPLLYGGSECLVLVTSRQRLSGLVADHGAVRVALEPLATEDSRALIAWLTRLPDGPKARAAAVVAELCAGLPLALRIAAANLAEEPGLDPAAYLARLSDGDRLASLQIDDSPDAAIRNVFESSYRAIPAEARRLFRLLGMVPGPDFTAEAAARLASTSVEDAEAVLDRLVAAHLVDRYRPGRYRLHDLLRLYAEERTGAEETPQKRAEATGRLFDWYLHCAHACREALAPAMTHLPVPEWKEARFEPTPGAAAEWLDSERGNLVAAVEHAAEHGPASIAWLLSDALRAYAWSNMSGPDAVRLNEAAIGAAERAGDRLGLAAAELGLSLSLIRSRRSAKAIEHGDRAARLAEEAGWVMGQAAAANNLIGACSDIGRLREGIVYGETALRLCRECGQLTTQCVTLDALGNLHADLGEIHTAAEYFLAEHETAISAGNDAFESIGLINLADVELMRGRLGVANDHIDKVLKALDGRPIAGFHFRHHQVAARIHLAAGRLDRARASAEQAIDGLPEFPWPQLECDTISTLAAVRDAMGEHRDAIDLYDRALDLSKREALFHWIQAMIGRATAQYRLGMLDHARDDSLRALEPAHGSEFRRFEGEALNVIAKIELALERPADADKHAELALRLNRETGYRLAEAESLHVNGDVREAAGDSEGARRYRREARDLYDEMGAVPPPD